MRPDRLDKPAYGCVECHLAFSAPVWHCVRCDHHWPDGRDLCHNCYRARGEAPLGHLTGFSVRQEATGGAAWLLLN